MGGCLACGHFQKEMSKPTPIHAPKPYFNDTEYQKIIKTKCSAKKVAKLRALADAGNIQAAFAYGDLLMTGAWDMARMESDLALERLIPPTLDPTKDPYLVLPRDQYQAVNYLKIAAEYPDENACLEISKARAHLKYCSRRGNTGYNGHGKLDKIMLELFYIPMERAASRQELQLNPFFPLPYLRPKISNPKAKVFSGIAAEIIKYNGLQSIIFHVLALALIISVFRDTKDTLVTKQIVLLEMFTFIAFTIPLLLVILISIIFGSANKKPLCSCSDARKAHDVAMDGISKDLKTTDPFKETPLIVRNIHSVQITLFVAYIIIAVIVSLLDLNGVIKLKKFIPENMINPVLFVSVLFPVLALALLQKLVPPFNHKICEAELMRTEMEHKDGFLSQSILKPWN